MSDIVTLHSDVQAMLQAKTSFNGIAIVTVDSLEVKDDIDTALQYPAGLVVQVGTVTGEHVGEVSLNFTSVLRCKIFENIRLNRRRTLNNTVANQAARLALTGVPIGDRVVQSDVGKSYWHVTGTGSAVLDWAEVMSATQIMQLVIKSVHNFNPVNYQTLVAAGFNFSDDLERARAECFFSTRLYLDMTPVP